MNNNLIVLAAGKGSRMMSNIPKVNHMILDKPMINYILDAFSEFNKNIVVGFKSELVKKIIKHDVKYYYQSEQLGTAHAVKCVSDLKENTGITVVINGDLPFISADSINNALELFKQRKAALVLFTCEVEDANDSGRIVIENDCIIKIVEAREADFKDVKIKCVNVGLYIFDNYKLFKYLSKIQNNNAQKEFYLTEIVQYLVEDGHLVLPYNVPYVESLSANNLHELANMEIIYQAEIINKHRQNGVRISSNNVIIGPDVKIESGVTIRNFSYITGNVEIMANTVVGPFARLRDNTIIHKDCLIGNYVEIKDSIIMNNTKIAHHAYIGNALIYSNTNIGCGVITANYDGINKHNTMIGSNCFIGSNVTLVAPVTLGDNCFVAAGSVVSKNMENNSFVIGRSEVKIMPNKR